VGKASASEIFNMAKKGDLPSKRITLDAVDAISKMVSNLIEIFDPEVVVLNGGVVTNDWFFQMIKKTLTKKSKQSASKEIVLSNLNPSTVGLVGASVLGLEKY
jgi:glucokinase